MLGSTQEGKIENRAAWNGKAKRTEPLESEVSQPPPTESELLNSFCCIWRKYAIGLLEESVAPAPGVWVTPVEEVRFGVMRGCGVPKLADPVALVIQLTGAMSERKSCWKFPPVPSQKKAGGRRKNATCNPVETG